MKMKRALSVIALMVLSGKALGTTLVTPKGFVHVAQQCNVPAKNLYAIALTETETAMEGGGSGVWQNSINWKGKSYFFSSRQETYDFALSLLHRGYESFDVGIMQVNWKWQKHRGYSLWELTDIQTNVKVGCEILREGYKARGNWILAAGYYHAPNHKENAERYMKIYAKKLARIEG